MGIFLPTTSTCQVALRIPEIHFLPALLPTHTAVPYWENPFLKFGSQTDHGFCALDLAIHMHTGLQKHLFLC